ncbi:hypothetical protein [Sphingobium sp. DC-2]|nr:hypothetical protein [Sphingobium sp. DC-2]
MGKIMPPSTTQCQKHSDLMIDQRRLRFGQIDLHGGEALLQVGLLPLSRL